MTRLFHLNPAEAIFAALHDPELAATLPITVRGAVGARFACAWGVNVHCPAVAPGEVATELTLGPIEVPLAGFDELTFCLSCPRSQAVVFSVDIDGEMRDLGPAIRGRGDHFELTFPIRAGARTLRAVTARFIAQDENAATVNLSWFGLANTALRAQLHAAKPTWDPAWPGCILPHEQWPANRPFQRGLLFDAADLPRLRAKAATAHWRPHVDMIHRRAREAMARVPEHDIGDFVPWSDTRYLRERERNRLPLWHQAVDLAFIARLDGNDAMLRHALRFLLSMVHCRHWCQSAESRTPGSTWDQRCFLEEMAAYAVALVYDWLGFALSEQARSVVLQALWDKGLAIIERDMMKFEYVYHINQGPWFCRARILGGLLLESVWPRVGDYVDRAARDLRESLDRYILPDGGADEGAGYLSLTLHAAIPALIAYARARHIDPHTVLPAALCHTDRYLATLSAASPGRVLLEGDNSTDRLPGDTVAILASLYPESPTYRAMLAESLAHHDPEAYFAQYQQQGFLSLVLGPETLDPPHVTVPSFAILPHTGHLTSLRRSGKHSTRIHIVGCKANASHTHADKGGFILEVDGLPMLIDRGILRYDDARVPLLKTTPHHNCITPCFDGRTFIDQVAASMPVIPTGTGDGKTLTATIDLSNVWRDHMSYCTRGIRSSDLDSFTLTDAGALLRPGRIVFHLQALSPFAVGNTPTAITLSHDGCALRITAPWAVQARCTDDLVDFRHRPVWHLELWGPPLPAGVPFAYTTQIERT